MDLYKWLVIVAGLTIIFQLAGIPTGSQLILEKAGVDLLSNPESFSLSNLIATITLVFSAVAVTGIIVGFFAQSSPIPFILAGGYTALLLSFVADSISIINYAFGTYEAWIGWIVLMILLPVSIGYAHSIVTWLKS